MSEEKIETWSPFWDTDQWKEGEWYPLPFGNMTDRIPLDRYVIEGWGIYMLRKGAGNGDIDPVYSELGLSFSAALELCEAHNDRVMMEDE